MFKFKRPRAMFEADGSGGGGDAPQVGGGGGTDATATEIAKYQSEVARLGKLVNESAEKEKARQAEEAKKTEDEAKARGEFEKLATDYKTSLDDVTVKHTTASEQLTKYDEHFKVQFDTAIKSLEKGQKEVIERLLDGKSNFEKATLLPDLLTQFGGNSFGKDPKGGKTPGDVDKSKDLLAKGDVRGSLGVKLAGL